MGCGLSLCRKSKQDQSPSPSNAPVKQEIPTTQLDTSPLLQREEIDIQESEPVEKEADITDDADKELQQLEDDKTDRGGSYSPPPTLEGSRVSSRLSDQGISPLPIAAVATIKTLESPRSVIFTSTRPNSTENELDRPRSSIQISRPHSTINTPKHIEPVTSAHLPSSDPTSVQLNEVQLDDEEKAATKIQAAYRGHRTRRSISDKAAVGAAAIGVGVGAVVAAGFAAATTQDETGDVAEEAEIPLGETLAEQEVEENIEKIEEKIEDLTEQLDQEKENVAELLVEEKQALMEADLEAAEAIREEIDQENERIAEILAEEALVLDQVDTDETQIMAKLLAEESEAIAEGNAEYAEIIAEQISEEAQAITESNLEEADATGELVNEDIENVMSMVAGGAASAAELLNLVDEVSGDELVVAAEDETATDQIGLDNEIADRIALLKDDQVENAAQLEQMNKQLDDEILQELSVGDGELIDESEPVPEEQAAKEILLSEEPRQLPDEVDEHEGGIVVDDHDIRNDLAVEDELSKENESYFLKQTEDEVMDGATDQEILPVEEIAAEEEMVHENVDEKITSELMDYVTGIELVPEDNAEISAAVTAEELQEAAEGQEFAEEQGLGEQEFVQEAADVQELAEEQGLREQEYIQEVTETLGHIQPAIDDIETEVLVSETSELEAELNKEQQDQIAEEFPHEETPIQEIQQEMQTDIEGSQPVETPEEILETNAPFEETEEAVLIVPETTRDESVTFEATDEQFAAVELEGLESEAQELVLEGEDNLLLDDEVPPGEFTIEELSSEVIGDAEFQIEEVAVLEEATAVADALEENINSNVENAAEEDLIDVSDELQESTTAVEASEQAVDEPPLADTDGIIETEELVQQNGDIDLSDQLNEGAELVSEEMADEELVPDDSATSETTVIDLRNGDLEETIAIENEELSQEGIDMPDLQFVAERASEDAKQQSDDPIAVAAAEVVDVILTEELDGTVPIEERAAENAAEEQVLGDQDVIEIATEEQIAEIAKFSGEDESVENITEPVTEEEVTEESRKAVLDENIGVAGEERAEIAAEEIPEAAVEETTVVFAEERAEIAAEEIPEAAVEETTVVFAEEHAEIVAEENGEVAIEERAEIAAEEIAEVTAEENAEAAAEGFEDIATEENAEVVNEQAREKAIELVAEGLGIEANQTGDEVIESAVENVLQKDESLLVNLNEQESDEVSDKIVADVDEGAINEVPTSDVEIIGEAAENADDSVTQDTSELLTDVDEVTAAVVEEELVQMENEQDAALEVRQPADMETTEDKKSQILAEAIMEEAMASLADDPVIEEMNADENSQELSTEPSEMLTNLDEQYEQNATELEESSPVGVISEPINEETIPLSDNTVREVEDSKAAENIENNEDTKQNDEEENETSTVVDQAFDEIFHEETQKNVDSDEEEIWRKLQKDISLEEEQQAEAATKIQASFRGYMARKQLKDNKNLNNENESEEASVQEMANDPQENTEKSDYVVEKAAESLENDQPVEEASEAQERTKRSVEQLEGVDIIQQDNGNDSNEAELISSEIIEDIEHMNAEEHEHADGTEPEIHEAIAELTEQVAKVALYLTTPIPRDTIDDESALITENNTAIEKGHLQEDILPQSDIEFQNIIDDVQVEDQLEQVNLIDSYDIDTRDKPVDTHEEVTEQSIELPGESSELVDEIKVLDSYDMEIGNLEDVNTRQAISELSIEAENQSENLPTVTEDDASNKEESKNLESDPSEEGMLEFYVKSDETIHDGLVESGWIADPFTYEELEAAGVTVTVDKCQDDDDHPSYIENHDGDWTDCSGSAREDSESPTTSYLNDVFYQNAATKIQAGYRGYRTRQLLKRKKYLQSDCSAQESRIEDNSLHLRADLMPVNNDRLHAAATKIQASFRGYRVRRELNRPIQSNGPRWTLLQNARQNSLSESSNSRPQPDFNKAATKIQAGVRGFLVRRRQLKNRQVSSKPVNSVNVSSVSCPSWLSKHRGLQTRRGSLPEQRKVMQLREMAVRRNSESLLEEEAKKPRTKSKLTETTNGEAATKIQAAYRGYRVRQQIKSKTKMDRVHSDSSSHDEFQKKKAATIIQAGYRGYRTRKQLQNKFKRTAL